LTLGALKYTRDQVWTSGLLEIRHTPLRLTHLPRLSVDTEAFDMWALGCVLYIMLAGRHPFDPTGRATDEEIEEAIKKGSPPTRDSPYTSHLSDSAVNLLERLLQNKQHKRPTAMQMLEHPWTKGMTARTDKTKDIDTKLNAFRTLNSMPSGSTKAN
jgi:serine/threonine protein kinase